jgi:hypothetical protein
VPAESATTATSSFVLLSRTDDRAGWLLPGVLDRHGRALIGRRIREPDAEPAPLRHHQRNKFAGDRIAPLPPGGETEHEHRPELLQESRPKLDVFDGIEVAKDVQPHSKAAGEARLQDGELVLEPAFERFAKLFP